MNSLATSEDSVRAPVESGGDAKRLLRWQQEIKAALRDPVQLCQHLSLPVELADAAKRGAGEFPLFVPPAYLAKITPADPADPLLRQVLPLAAELAQEPSFTPDPVDDQAAELTPGLLHKYHGRALLVTTGACAVHCRYCFRRHYPYSQTPHRLEHWQPAIKAIAADTTLQEIILSGGDPLMLIDNHLSRLIDALEPISHIRRLRIHTRLPVMVPSRVTDVLVQRLRESRFTCVVVLHVNHAQELGQDTAIACNRLASAGATLLNQAVLLRGINDSVGAQCELSERLVEQGIVPYYLHQLDRVAGAAHFEVPESEGRAIVETMRNTMPGYLVPKYVKEQPGAASKTPLIPK